MKTAYLDCIFGVSGDMILGALAACGVPLKKLTEELHKLHIHGFELTEEKIIDHGISAVHVNVITEHQHEHRHLSDIKSIIESSGLSDKIKTQAVEIFTKLAIAEASVHGTTPENIHFHEVGALDAIVDVVGACIGFDMLGAERILSTPLHLGSGTVKCAHGLLPLPAPAVVELTKGFPTVRTSFEGEMTTPTGAAIVTTLAKPFSGMETFISEVSGYGAGTRKREEFPNVLRISVGNVQQQYETDYVSVIETNIDDMNPEFFGFISEKLFGYGAKDVYMTPVYMKKGRPGTLLTVIAGESDISKISDLIFAESTTIGLRIYRTIRKKLKRQEKTVETELGKVKVKSVFYNGTDRITPEYEDCARIAREKGIPLIKVYEAVVKGKPE